MRIFKNVPGKSKWLSHEPPSYMYNNIVCNNGKVLTRDFMLNYGIKMYHYSYVIEKQIDFKSKFFKNDNYIKFWNDFKNDKHTKIFGSQVYEFNGEHPTIIKQNYL